MAEGYLNYFAGERAAVYSAGLEQHGVHAMAIQVMKEDGIDISHHTSNHVNEYKNIPFDIVITVCDHAREQCPVLPAKTKRLHHRFADPAQRVGTPEEIHAAFVEVRDEIKKYCMHFIQSNLQ